MNFFLKIGKLFSRKQIAMVFFLIILGVGAAILDTGSTYIILPFVYAIMDQQGVSSGVMKKIYDLLACKTNTDFVIRLAILIAILYVVTALYKIMEAYLTARFRNSTRHALAERAFKKTIFSEYSEITHINSAEVQRIVSSDISRVNAVVVQMINIITSVLTSISLIAVLWFLNKGITIFAGILIISVIFLINKPITARVKKIGNQITETNTTMVKSVQQFFGGYKTILACGLQASVEKKFTKESKKNSEAYLKASTLEAIPMHLSQGIIMSAIFIYMAIIAIIGINLSTMLPTLATFALAAMKLLPLVGRISSAFVAIRVDIPAIDSVKSFLDKIPDYDHIINYPFQDDTGFHTEIRVNDLSFAFPNSDNFLFSHISLTIPACKAVAFIGPTGAGKTTLADIIIGLYKPQGGQVLADGKDIQENKRWWASQIGYITQRIYLLDDTIRANVAYESDEYPDDERIWECLKEACIDELVRSLPDGLDTVCGENGVRFSGGQQQRIGIARALYNNPSVLVFDEATSALDTETEEEIVKSIENLAGRKTMIIIAHRLSTIKNCNYIYRIDKCGVELLSEDEMGEKIELWKTNT